MSWICSKPIYQFKGWIFEYHMTGIWPLKKDFEPRKRAGNKFWSVADEFCQLSDEEKRRYRVAGGFVQF